MGVLAVGFGRFSWDKVNFIKAVFVLSRYIILCLILIV